MDNIAWKIGQDDRSDWEDKNEIRLAEYFRIREKTDTLYQIQARGRSTPVSRANCLPRNSLRRSAAGLWVNANYRRQVEWFRLNGKRVIERAILPGTYIPVVRCQGNARNIDGKVYRRGMVRFLQDPQRMVDYGEVAKIKRLGLTPQSPWVVAEGQLDGHPEWTDSTSPPIRC